MDFYTIQIVAYQDVPSWVSFLNHNRVSKRHSIPNNLIVDFALTQEILPYHIVSLACLIEEYYALGAKIVFWAIDNRAVDHMAKLDFFQYWTPGFNRRAYRACVDGTSYCLWQIDKEMFLSYVSHAREYFQRQFFKGRDLIPFNQSLVELFNNVIDHSQSKVSGYVFTQYFPNWGKFIISLCDFGLGIPGTINEYFLRNNKPIVTSLDAMDLAFQKGFTVGSKDNNGGLGLDYILSITKTLQGELVIFSNYAHISQNRYGKFIKKELPEEFLGTQVVVTLNTQNLNPLIIDEHNIFH